MLKNNETDSGDQKPPSSLQKITREELMAKASELIELLHKRTTQTRFKEGRHDRARLAYARASVAALTAYGALLRDADLEELKRRIEALENGK